MAARRLSVGNRRVRAEGRSSASERERAVLLSRIADLELRLQLLEARVRREAGQAKVPGKAGKPEPKGRPRPRCPGCLLELPKGNRRELCVWCGCEMAAVGGAFR